jgi:hypothetical protein
MDRRKTLKTLFGGAVGTALFTQTGCKDETGELVPVSKVGMEPKGYGLRTAYEAEREERILADRFFTDFELETIAVLADIIVPESEEHVKATDTGVVDFIEFMAKDQPNAYQRQLRGGLAWINTESSRRYDGKAFIELTPEQQLAIVDDIAYELPRDQQEVDHDLLVGVRFFDRLRFLVVTGFYTSKEGIAYLGYEGNQPNVWDGVPQDVLDKHGLAYEDELLPKYVDQERRTITAEWDDEGNLIT